MHCLLFYASSHSEAVFFHFFCVLIHTHFISHFFFPFQFLYSRFLFLIAIAVYIVVFPSFGTSFFKMHSYLLIKSPGGIFRAPRVNFELCKGKGLLCGTNKMLI